MKKIVTLIAACGLLLGSCAKTEPAAGDEPGAVTFKVTAVNALDTRGDIYSSSAAGTIPAMASVNVFAFKDNGSGDFLYALPIDMTSAYKTDTNSAQQRLADGTIPAGNYKFLGIARASLTDGYTLPDLAEGVTNFDAITASITAASSNTNVIFAGFIEQEVLPTGANIEFEIFRQVAGIFGYMSNVPVDILGTPVQYLRLRVSSANLAVNLGTGEGDATTNTGTSYYALDIDLTGQPVDEANNVYRGVLPPEGVAVATNSQIASNYAIPADGVTMQLVLQSADGTDLKVWNLQYNGSSTINLEANVLVSIGTKNAADTTLGSDGQPGDSTGDGSGADDVPASLLTDETIIVTLNKNWNEVQNLTLVEQ